MTCNEFWQLMDKDPLGCTSAERAGGILHYRECPSCRKGQRRVAAEAKKELQSALGPLGYAIADKIMDAHVDNLATKDQADPEVQAMLRPNP